MALGLLSLLLGLLLGLLESVMKLFLYSFPPRIYCARVCANLCSLSVMLLTGITVCVPLLPLFVCPQVYSQDEVHLFAWCLENKFTENIEKGRKERFTSFLFALECVLYAFVGWLYRCAFVSRTMSFYSLKL